MKSFVSLTLSLCLMACLLPFCLSHYPQGYSYSNFYQWPRYNNRLDRPYFQASSIPTLTLMEEKAYSMDSEMTEVPLVLVPSNRLKVVQGSATYFSPTRYGHEELPAIRLVLPQPILVSHPTQMIEFPAGFTVLHEGYRVPMSVAVVLAPVLSIGVPQQIRIVYALPAQNIAYQNHQQPSRRPVAPTGPIASSYRPPQSVNTYRPPQLSNTYLPPSNSYPASSSNYQTPSNSYQTPNNAYLPPSNTYLPVSNKNQMSNRPTPNSSSGLGSSQQNRPTVTILDFPSAVSTPNVLFFQPPLDPESELGNRDPPQAVVPAGIVQSTAPLPNLSLFINSKESQILQILRDEAQRNRLANSKNSYSDYEVIDN